MWMGSTNRPTTRSERPHDGPLHRGPVWSRIKGLCARLAEPVDRRNLFADDHGPDAVVPPILGPGAGRHSSADLLPDSAVVIVGIRPIGDCCARSERVAWDIDCLRRCDTPRRVAVSYLAHCVAAASR